MSLVREQNTVVLGFPTHYSCPSTSTSPVFSGGNDLYSVRRRLFSINQPEALFNSPLSSEASATAVKIASYGYNNLQLAMNKEPQVDEILSVFANLKESTDGYFAIPLEISAL